MDTTVVAVMAVLALALVVGSSVIQPAVAPHRPRPGGHDALHAPDDAHVQRLAWLQILAPTVVAVALATGIVIAVGVTRPNAGRPSAAAPTTRTLGAWITNHPAVITWANDMTQTLGDVADATADFDFPRMRTACRALLQVAANAPEFDSPDTAFNAASSAAARSYVAAAAACLDGNIDKAVDLFADGKKWTDKATAAMDEAG